MNNSPTKRPLIPAIAIIGALLIMPVHGLTITLVYDDDPSAPVVDADGAKLMFIAEAAANYWEDLIKDNHNLTVTISYTNSFSDNRIAEWSETNESGGRPTAGRIKFRSSTAWYFDTTPYDHSEYNMQQTIFRNQPGSDLINFNGNPPQTLETAYVGAALQNAPDAAKTATDVFSVMLHEMGHGVGMSLALSTCNTELNDDEFDLLSSQLNGAVMSVAAGLDTGAHLLNPQTLMSASIPAGLRRLPSALDVLAIATCPSPAWTSLDLRRKDFLPGGSMVWNTAGNWVGNRVPDGLDDAAIRYGQDIQQDVLIGLSGHAFCRNLLLTSASSLRTNSWNLSVGDLSSVIFDGNFPVPTVRVEAGAQFSTDDLLAQGGDISMESGHLEVDVDLTLGGETLGERSDLIGDGTVNVGGELRNDGRISATSGNLIITSTNFNDFDLDGVNNGGSVYATGGSVRFMNGGTTDNFNGHIQVNAGHDCTIDGPWSLGSGGLLRLIGGVNDFSELKGGFLVANAGVLQPTGKTRITNPAQFGSGFQANLGINAELQLAGTTTFNGSTYNLPSGSLLFGTQPVVINGGTFNLSAGSQASFINSVELKGGNYNGDGTLGLTGDTTVNLTTTINCAAVILDAFNNPAKQLVLNNKRLTINSDTISFGNNTFDSTLEINGASGKLEMAGPTSWEMAGTLHITGDPNAYNSSISGTTMTMSGTTDIQNMTKIEARILISGDIILSGVEDKLLLTGGSFNDRNRLEGGTVTGNGLLSLYAKSLEGFGGISADLSLLNGGSLFAEDGTLLFTGSFVDAPAVLGTKNNTARLNISSPWTLAYNHQIHMKGGYLQGGAITNESIVHGHGEINTQQIVNNGTITAEQGETMFVNTVQNPDLDGNGQLADVQSHTLNALAGSIVVSRPLSDAFSGTANVTTGKHLEFQSGWTLDWSGTLNMTDDTLSNPAVLTATNSLLNGSIHADGTVRFSTPATFQSNSTTTLADANTVISLTGNTVVASGAQFSGPGKLRATNNINLQLADGAVVDVAVQNTNAILLVGNSPGSATVASYEQLIGGTMTVEINGPPNSSDYDQLVVTGEANLAGQLIIDFGAAGAQPGDTWKVISAGTVIGSFDTFQVTGTPAGQILQKFETADGVYITLAAKLTYAKWSANEGLDGTNNGIGQDPDHDLIINALEMFMGLDPLASDLGQNPPLVIANVNGLDYLSISVPLDTNINPADLELVATRSTDLQLWSDTEVLASDEPFDPVEHLLHRTFISQTPIGELDKEFLRLELRLIAP